MYLAMLTLPLLGSILLLRFLSNSAGLQKINGNDTENIIVSSEG
jgi:hypothetical protein